MLVNLFAGTLTVMFLIGLAGCLIVIPITAYRLFSILFGRDVPEDEISPTFAFGIALFGFQCFRDLIG